ncbi:hypothetical protein AB0H51_04855 [Streptomyces griseoluteus]|uniref:hypothetical protein n=1 Tax=Streptomyces griseoluteus TaxID=29306 RepID=UPI0033CEF473
MANHVMKEYTKKRAEQELTKLKQQHDKEVQQKKHRKQGNGWRQPTGQPKTKKEEPNKTQHSGPTLLARNPDQVTGPNKDNSTGSNQWNSNQSNSDQSNSDQSNSNQSNSDQSSSNES